MKAYNFRSQFSNLKYTSFSFFKNNKIKIIVVAAIILLALVTGIFSAIKFVNGNITIVFSDFGIKEFVSGSIGSGQMFFQRLLSYTVILLLLLLCSLTAFLFPIGVIILVYRSFLLGLNITIIIISYGFSGIITAVLIIFPLQLVLLIVMLCFFILARDRCIVKSKYGNKKGINVFLLFLIFVLILTLLNLVETLLLILTSAKVILII